MPRAPRGAVEIAEKVARLSSQVGRERAATALGYSPRTVARMEKAAREGGVGRVFFTPRGLANWRNAFSEAREKGAIREAREAAREVKGIAKEAKAIAESIVEKKYTSSQVADAIKQSIGIKQSYQGATALRLRAEAGKATPADLEKLNQAKEFLEANTPQIVTAPSGGQTLLYRGHGMLERTTENFEVRARTYTTLADVLNRWDTIAGSAYFGIVEYEDDDGNLEYHLVYFPELYEEGGDIFDLETESE